MNDKSITDWKKCSTFFCGYLNPIGQLREKGQKYQNYMKYTLAIPKQSLWPMNISESDTDDRVFPTPLPKTLDITLEIILIVDSDMIVPEVSFASISLLRFYVSLLGLNALN